jgi:hypothetical protein
MAFDLGGRRVDGAWVDASASPSKGVVLLLYGAEAWKSPDVPVLGRRLSRAGYSSVRFPSSPALKAPEISAVLSRMKTLGQEGVPLSLIAFGDAGSDAWSALVDAAAIMTSAVFISSPLPNPRPDFAAFRRVAVRGIYAETGKSYSSSYTDAHLGMAAANTPHDFLIYGGGVTDRFYSPASREFHEATQTAAFDGALEWLDVRGELGRPVGASSEHGH